MHFYADRGEHVLISYHMLDRCAFYVFWLSAVIAVGVISSTCWVVARFVQIRSIERRFLSALSIDEFASNRRCRISS
uniref:Copper transporter n=1 Tax=Ascaris lumbricoides TaxID=6252 RepID=A0A0M3IGJ9_ASCLU